MGFESPETPWGVLRNARRIVGYAEPTGYLPAPCRPPNSLRSAALVQRAMFVQRLREKFPGVPVTETHPKAAAIALGGWDGLQIAALGCPAGVGEHERDAYFSAVAAREGFSGKWVRDLSLMRSESEPRCEQTNPRSTSRPSGRRRSATRARPCSGGRRGKGHKGRDT